MCWFVWWWFFFFFKQKTAYEILRSDWSSDVCSSDLGSAMFVSLLVALRSTGDWIRRTALGLGGIATTAFAGLPILRGYWFYSGGDGLTHLGWARGIQVGNFLPTDLRYPGMHTVTILLDTAFGIDLAHAMLLVVVVLSVLFFAC